MYLLYISKNNLEVFKNYQKVGETSWTPENLSQNLSRIKSNYSSKFRVLLADDFISVTSLLLDSKESKNRKSIQSKFQSVVSQDLSQTVWDYKIVAQQNGKKLVQVVYVIKNFFDQFRTALQSAKIKVSLIESFSTSISRFLPAKKLVLVNYQDLLVLAFNQTPIFSKVLFKKITQHDIDEVFEHSKQCFQTLPQQILFSPAGDVAFSQFDFGNLVPEYTSLDPLKGIIHSQNIHGSDSSTSKLDIKTNSDTVKIPTSFPKIVLVVPLLLLVIALFVIFGSKLKSSPTPEVSPVISVTPTIAITPTPIPVESLKIKVLNGSGVSGEASKITDLISKYKFSVAEAGNADNFDYTSTQIQTKKIITTYTTDLLIEALGAKYPAKVLPEKLSDSDQFDIIITTGK